MSIQVSSYSRFFTTDTVVFEGKETFGLLVERDFLKRENLEEDQIIKFKVQPEYAGRPDLIANDVYGTPYLDWVVTLFNKPRNPLNWPYSGTTIELPRADKVVQETI